MKGSRTRVSELGESLSKSGIEIDSYSRAYPDGTVKKYVVKGMKYTGWDDEMKEYNDFVNEGKFK